jgi:PST family polysaccharide transporter
MMLRALLTIGFLQVLTMLVLLLRTKGLALLLGPELVGVMAVIDRLLAVFAQTASLSMPFAALRFLPASSRGDPAEFGRLFQSMLNLLAILIAAATAVGLAFALFWPKALGVDLLPYRGLVAVAFLTLPAAALVPFVQNAIAGRLEHNRSMLFALSHAVVLALTALVGVSWRGLFGFYALYAAAGLALAAGGVRWLRAAAAKGARGARGRARFAIRLPRRIWKFALALAGLTFIAPYAALFVSYEVLSTFGAETAGWMQAAIGVSLSVRALLGSAHALFLTPNVNRDDDFEERMRWAVSFQRSFCFLAAVALPPLLLFPRAAVSLLYSDAFVPGARFVALFVTMEVVTLLAGTYGALVVAFDHIAFHVATNVAAQSIVIALAAWLIPPQGIAGAALAGLAAQLFLYAATWIFLRLKHGLEIPLRSTALTFYAVASLGTAGALGTLYAAHDLRAVLVKGLAYLALIGMLSLFVTREEWAELAASARARFRGESAA